MIEESVRFYEQLIELKASPPPASVPPIQSGNLYPEGQPPSVLIHVGEPDPLEVARIRALLPPASYLLYLCDAQPADSAGVMGKAINNGERTFVCTLTADSCHIEKIGMLVSLCGKGGVRLVVGAGKEQRFATEMAEIRKTIAMVQENASQDAIRGLIRLRCSVRNLPTLLDSQRHKLRPAGSSISAVVCGAGPSLATQMDLLRAVSNKVLLIAVGHAAPSLLKAGIAPHLVVETDYMAWRNWPADIHLDSVLVAGTDVAPAVAARFSSTQWFHGNSPPFSQTLTAWGIPLRHLAMGRSVSVSAFDLALQLGCGTVALVGQDLSIGEAGVSHVGGETVSDGDALVTVDGNDGRPVLATHDLLVLKEAVEDYFSSPTVRHGSTRFVNCTRGGARIAGVDRLAFEQFCEGLAQAAPVPMDWLMPADTPPQNLKCVRLLADAVETYAGLADRLVELCKRMGRDLSDPGVDMGAIRKAQARLQDLLARETTLRDEPVAGIWLNTLLAKVDDIMEQTPGLISQETDPHAQLALLQARFRLLSDLCGDIVSDLRPATVARSKNGKEGKARTGRVDLTVEPYRFRSFRRHAISLIRPGNEALAGFLDRSDPVDISPTFLVTWMNQVVPYVQMCDAADAWRPMSSFLSMYDDALRDLSNLAPEPGFDPVRHGLVMVGGGNWIYPLVFAKRHPGAELIVVDPWLDLFNHLIERGQFLHPLMPHGLVVAADDRAGDWRAVCASRLSAWQRSGRTPLFFIPPPLRTLPVIQTLATTVSTL